MKKLIMMLAALMAAFAVAQEPIRPTTFVSPLAESLNVTNGIPDDLWTHFGDPNAIAVTTNMVFCYEVTTAHWEPCACPDGKIGCAVLHMKKVEDKQYIPIRLADRAEVGGCDYVPILVKGRCIWMHAADCRCLREQHRKEKEERRRKAKNGNASNP